MASTGALEYLGEQYDGGGVGGLVEGGAPYADEITARDFARDLDDFLARGAVPVIGGDWSEEPAPDPEEKTGGTLEGLLVAIGGDGKDAPGAESDGAVASIIVGADVPAPAPAADGPAPAPAADGVSGGAAAAFVTAAPGHPGTVAGLIE